MPDITKSAAARSDLVDHFVYLAEEASEAVADRFLARAEESFALLAGEPLIGAPLTLQDPQLIGMRKWRVKDFDKFLVFYMPRPHGVLIARVLHTSQDWWQLLGMTD
jgi:toxin ParE1/3/4